MGCGSLLDFPWGFKDGNLVREVEERRTPPGYDGTLRGNPRKWTLEVWREVYGFPKGGKDMATRREDCTKDWFLSKADAKDGYLVRDCKEPRMRNVMAFLVPIFYPEKPTRVTATLASTIILSFEGRRNPNWTKLMRDVVAKLAVTIGRSKPTPICPYLYHLYQNFALLSEPELIEWDTQKNLQDFASSESEPEPELEPEPEAEPELGSEEEDDDLVVGRVQPGRPGMAPRRTRASLRMATGSSSPGRKGLVKGRPREECGSPEPAGTGVTGMSHIIRDLEGFELRLATVESELAMVAAHFGNPPKGQLLETVERRLKEKDGRQECEEEKRELHREVQQLQALVGRMEEEHEGLRNQATTATQLLQRMQETLKYPSDLTNKALLFEASMEQLEAPSRDRIIKFLSAQGCKMERIRSEMQGLLGQILRGVATTNPGLKTLGYPGLLPHPQEGMTGSNGSSDPTPLLPPTSPRLHTPLTTITSRTWGAPSTTSAGLVVSQSWAAQPPTFRSFLTGNHTPQALFGTVVTSESTSSETAIARGVAVLANLSHGQETGKGERGLDHLTPLTGVTPRDTATSPRRAVVSRPMELPDPSLPSPAPGLTGGDKQHPGLEAQGSLLAPLTGSTGSGGLYPQPGAQVAPSLTSSENRKQLKAHGRRMARNHLLHLPKVRSAHFVKQRAEKKKRRADGSGDAGGARKRMKKTQDPV